MKSAFAIGFAVVTAILSILIHGYLWYRLARRGSSFMGSSKLANHRVTRRRLISAVLVLMAVVPPAYASLRYLLPWPYITALAWLAFLWAGFLFFLVPTLLALDFSAWIGSCGWRRWFGQFRGQSNLRSDLDVDLERRRFISRVTAMTALSGASLVSVYGVHHALQALHIRRVSVTLPRLPKTFRGLRIVQLTDVHIGPTLGRKFAEEIVQQVNRLQPDMVAITGDLVDASIEDIGDAVAVFGNIRSEFGTFFAPGNHEYYVGADPWLRFLSEAGLRVLRNQSWVLDVDRQKLAIVGVDDWQSYRFGAGANLPRALHGIDEHQPFVLLAHQPRAFPQAKSRGVDLQLSGHTHGGQMMPVNLLVRLQQPFVQGLHRSDASQIYVSPGTGFWGPPMRVGTQAEITLLELS